MQKKTQEYCIRKRKQQQNLGGRKYTFPEFDFEYYEGSAPSLSGDPATGFKTQTGADVTAYYYLQTTAPQPNYPEKGGKIFTYFIMKNDKQLRITYMVSPSQAAKTDIVEEMVKTAQLP